MLDPGSSTSEAEPLKFSDHILLPVVFISHRASFVSRGLDGRVPTPWVLVWCQEYVKEPQDMQLLGLMPRSPC